MPIPRISGLKQTFFNNPIRPNYFSNAGPSPAPQGADTFNLIMRDSRSLNQANEAEVSEGTLATFRIENPTSHNPHTIDCVSCHVAQSAQLVAIRQFPWLMLDLRGEQFRYVSQFNLTNQSRNAGNTTLLRSFGYDRKEPAVNQRVINETAQVLERLYP